MSEIDDLPDFVRGIEIPESHHYNGVQCWEWTEIGDDGKLRTFELTLSVSATPLDGSDEEGEDVET